MDARLPIAAVLACAASAAFAPAAPAAYAPRLSVGVAPADRPGKTVAFTSVVTQAADEEPTRSARLRFPRGFGYDLAALQRLTACTPAERDARACPESSRIGTATAMALGQTLTGGVHLGPAATIFVFLNNETLRLLGQEPKPIVARTEFRPDGGTNTVFDDLPTEFTATRFELALYGPPRAIVTAPPDCGVHDFVAEFTSRNGTRSTSTSPVTITGCPAVSPTPPRLTGVRLAPRTLTRGRRAILRYRIDRPATLDVLVRRAGRRQVLGRHRFAVASALTGRIGVATRGLTPGRFVVTLRATAGNRAVSRSFTFRVRPARAR